MKSFQDHLVHFLGLYLHFILTSITAFYLFVLTFSVRFNEIQTFPLINTLMNFMIFHFMIYLKKIIII